MHNATPIPGSPRTRDRIIASVSDLFYRNGTYLVGVDAIVTHVKITRATFYRHFPGKEALVVAYLQHRDTAVRDELEALCDEASCRAVVARIFALLKVKTASDAFRGCAFLIAATENPGSVEIQRVAREHKLFLRDLFDRLVPPGPAHDNLVEQLLVLYEGVLAAAVLRPDALAAAAAARTADLLLT